VTTLSAYQVQAQAELIRRARLRQSKPADTSIADPVGWITHNFIIPETNRPIDLYDSQVAPLREALAVENGQFRYSTVVWSAIKKSAKSSIAAAVGLWFAWRKPWSSIKVIANDLKQADSRVAYYMRRAIELRPDWRDQVKVVNYKMVFPNHSFIEAIPIDPKGEAGGNDDLVIFSELWGWKHEAAQKMWTEMTLSPMKFGQSLRWCETYAGATGEAPILEEMYKLAVERGEVIDREREMYRSGRLFVLWNTKPTLPWQTEGYYAQEAANLLPNEFARVHRNEWAQSSEAFIPLEWWQACKRELPAERKSEAWVIAMDAGVSNDCFGLVAVSRSGGKTIPRYVRKWVPPKGGKIEFSLPDGSPPESDETPAGELRRLVRSHNVVSVVYDPYQLHDLATRMKRKLVAYFREFPQGMDRLVADKALRDAIRDQGVLHDGNPDLTEHITNANAEAAGDNKLRMVKRSQDKKIDLAVCLSMANFEAVRMNIG
jgi:phage terminase large subunit-like protein